VFLGRVWTVELHHEDSPPFPLPTAADDLVLHRQYRPYFQIAGIADLHDSLFLNRLRDMINEENEEPAVSSSVVAVFLVHETYLSRASFVYAKAGYP